MPNICTRKEILPNELILNSPFGMSPANPPTTNETPVQSNLNLEHFELLGFPSSFINTLGTRIPLLMHSIPTAVHIENYFSVFKHEAFAQETLNKWKHMGTYEEVDHKPHLINPLGVVEREGRLRLVVDATASGLNDILYPPKFQLPTHTSIIRKLNYADYMAKADLKNGFLQLPMRRCEQTYLGFIHPFTRKYCVFLRLPFGLGSATFLFQTFTEGIKACLHNIFQIKSDVYIDDWLLTNQLEGRLTDSLQIFYDLCRFLRITINMDKSEGPTQSLTFLGLQIDTCNCTLSLTESKLVHVAAVHSAGWAQVKPFWDILYRERTSWTKRALKSSHFHLSDELKRCLKWWLRQMQHPLRRRIWRLPSDRLQL